MNELKEHKIKRVLLIGPLPPPMGGAPATFKALKDELSKDPAISVSVINSSPTSDVRKRHRVINLEKIMRFVGIISQYIGKVGKTDVTLVYANNHFMAITIPIMQLISRITGKKLFIKPVGGNLDVFLASLWRPIQSFYIRVFGSAHGILSQTQLLKDNLEVLGMTNVHYLPGFRSFTERTAQIQKTSDVYRLIFLAHIQEPKGPLVLLQSLNLLNGKVNGQVQCDFFGIIHDHLEKDFNKMLKSTPGVRYQGIAEMDSVIELIAQYDALVLPTFFDSEGHPGVLIEAMHAGIPVISTFHRAIPELITDGENGILVPVKNPDALARAIEKLAGDRSLSNKMGLENQRRGKEFTTEAVVTQLQNILFSNKMS